MASGQRDPSQVLLALDPFNPQARNVFCQREECCGMLVNGTPVSQSRPCLINDPDRIANQVKIGKTLRLCQSHRADQRLPLGVAAGA